MHKILKDVTINEYSKKKDSKKEKEKLYFSTIRAYKFSMYERNKLKEFERQILNKTK